MLEVFFKTFQKIKILKKKSGEAFLVMTPKPVQIFLNFLKFSRTSPAYYSSLAIRFLVKNDDKKIKTNCHARHLI